MSVLKSLQNVYNNGRFTCKVCFDDQKILKSRNKVETWVEIVSLTTQFLIFNPNYADCLLSYNYIGFQIQVGTNCLTFIIVLTLIMEIIVIKIITIVMIFK